MVHMKVPPKLCASAGIGTVNRKNHGQPMLQSQLKPKTLLTGKELSLCQKKKPNFFYTSAEQVF